MAESKFSRKYRTYRHLHHINRAFEYLNGNLEAMFNLDLLELDSLETWQNRLGEIQAEINKELTGNLHEQESKETRRLGQAVESWEEAQSPEKKSVKKVPKKSRK